jgi:hypothetical protein
MLKVLGAQTAECYRRAAESRELADCALNPVDREFHLQQEAAWLALARRSQLSDKIGYMVNELGPKGGGALSLTHTDLMSLKAPNCPSCCGEMLFNAVRPKYVRDMILVERAFFHCSACDYVSDYSPTQPLH